MKGFSLVEIAVVVLIAGMVVLAAVPVLRGVLPGGRLQSAARRLSASVNRLYSEAVFTGEYHSMRIDLEEGSYAAFTETPDSEPEPFHGAGGRLPDGIIFSDIDAAGRKYAEGVVRINFAPSGAVDPSIIRISDGGEKILSIIIEGYTGRVRVVEGYVSGDFR